MSTIPKHIEDKLREICDNSNGSWIGIATEAYQLATDGREELEKELANEKDVYKNLEEQFEKQCEYYIQLQSQCTEKEKECESLLKSCNEYSKMTERLTNEYLSQKTDLEELKAENTRLQKIVDIVNDRPDL